jgi:hypothetical protein
MRGCGWRRGERWEGRQRLAVEGRDAGRETVRLRSPSARCAPGFAVVMAGRDADRKTVRLRSPSARCAPGFAGLASEAAGFFPGLRRGGPEVRTAETHDDVGCECADETHAIGERQMPCSAPDTPRDTRGHSPRTPRDCWKLPGPERPPAPELRTHPQASWRRRSARLAPGGIPRSACFHRHRWRCVGRAADMRTMEARPRSPHTAGRRTASSVLPSARGAIRILSRRGKNPARERHVSRCA